MGEKYTTQPVVIDAEQWFPGINISGIIAISELPISHKAYCMMNAHFGGQNVRLSEIAWIEASDEGHLVLPGDWIVTWINGKKYPVKPEYFKIAFKKVEE